MQRIRKTIAVDIPNSIIMERVKGEDKAQIQKMCKDILIKEMPTYFDKSGNFIGIKVGFFSPVYLAQGKQRMNQVSRITFNIDEKTAHLLGLAKCYTSISSKNFAEIVILKSLLKEEKNFAKDRIVSDKQGNASDNQSQHSGERTCNI